MSFRIQAVMPSSTAYRAGIRAGDELLMINNEEIRDIIDYQAFSGKRHLVLHIRKENGSLWNCEIVKNPSTPLGIEFGEDFQLHPTPCKNHCVFCFIDQMPPGLRSTLYVKDDDWRFSLMMGNYITLTNVSDEEFDRIIRRKASPLFISVHALRPEIRVKMMANPQAAHLWDRLLALRDHGLHFHAQIVCCPGLNDGEVLEDTLSRLFSLVPCCVSAALVPVGLTKFRDRLYPLRPYSQEEARRVLAQCAAWQKTGLERFGSRIVYASDEFYCIAGCTIPQAEEYESYPQIENGVGMMRLFYDDFQAAISQLHAEGTEPDRRRFLIPCGTSIAPYLKQWIRECIPESRSVIVPIRNRFFGETITVTGLLTGCDLAEQLTQFTQGMDEVLLCSVTLRAEQDLFLDDMSLESLEKRLNIPLKIVENNGKALADALYGLRR